MKWMLVLMLVTYNGGATIETIPMQNEGICRQYGETLMPPQYGRLSWACIETYNGVEIQ